MSLNLLVIHEVKEKIEIRKKKKNPKSEKIYFFKLALSNFFAIKVRFYKQKKD